MNIIDNKRYVDIYFHRRGLIDIKASVVRALSLQDGDVINLWRTDSELYLYVYLRASDIRNPHARFRNSVHHFEGKRGHWRCHNINITNTVNTITNSDESWLFVGTPREIIINGTPTSALPLIISNNQYKKQ